MFLKPFRVKSNTTCKSSERKRLRGRICFSYPSLPQALLDELLPSKCTLASIRVFTHSNSNVTIFAVNDQPLFFDYENNLCPTVYTLWKCPEMLPSASTGPYVFTKLQGGADLMLPGVILPKSEVPELKGVEEGQLCSINLVGNRASVGVGMSLMSYDAMEASQWRGKGFKVLHLYRDRLWELGSKDDPPLLLPQPQVVEGESLERIEEESSDPLSTRTPSIKKGEVSVDSDGANMDNKLQVQFDVSCASDKNESSVTEPIEGTSCQLETTNSESPVTLSQKVGDTIESADFSTIVTAKPTPLDTLLSDDIKDDTSSEAVNKSNPEKLEDECDFDQSSKDLCEATGDGRELRDDESIEATPPLVPSMDDLLSECFCMAIKSSIKKEDLPVLTSTFYRSHMMPLCPLGFSLDIKKSTYKKLSKFLSAMQDEGVVKIKEVSKGVESITEIDFKHTKVKRMVPKYIHSRVKTVGESSSASPTSTTSASSATARVPQMIITQLYIPTHKVLPVFSPYGYSSATMMTQSMVREVITQYIKERELTSPTNSKLVILDPILTDAILKRGEAPPTELPWLQVITKIREEMRPGYSIQQGADKLMYKRTKLEPVRLSVTTRTGNKKATLVDNLDYYGISPTDVVHQVQRIAAASATVNNVSGRLQRQQVMVQGSNVKVIAKVLQEQHGLPLKHIEAVDKTKVPKAQKRQGSKR